MFPFSIGGSIRIKDKVSFSARAIEDEIGSTLIVRGIPIDYLPGGGFTFRLSVARLLGWTSFQGVSSGLVRCGEYPNGLRISYTLYFLHLELLITILLLSCKWVEKKFSPIPFPNVYYILVWFWLVGGNMFLTLFEFRRFLRMCAAESSHRVFFWRKRADANNDITTF